MPEPYAEEVPHLNATSTLTTEGGSWESNTMSKVKTSSNEGRNKNTAAKDAVATKPEGRKASGRTRKIQHAPNEELTVMQTLFSRCLCSESKWMFSSPSPQIELVSLDGIECIALGAVTDESSARERVELTVTLLATRTDRLINVGYLKKIPLSAMPSKHEEKRDDKDGESKPSFENVAEVIPIEAWKENSSRSSSKDNRSPDNHILPLDVGTVIEQIKVCELILSVLCLLIISPFSKTTSIKL